MNPETQQTPPATEPEYVVIGRSFRAAGGAMADDYHGRVVGSASAFYLVVYRPPGQVAGALAAGGGLVGGLIAAAASAVTDNSIKRPVGKLSELPAEVTGHPDWPVAPGTDYPVVVVPRAEVKRIRYSWWRTFDIVTPGQTFYVAPRTFGRGKALRRLRAWGWEC